MTVGGVAIDETGVRLRNLKDDRVGSGAGRVGVENGLTQRTWTQIRRARDGEYALRGGGSHVRQQERQEKRLQERDSRSCRSA